MLNRESFTSFLTSSEVIVWGSNADTDLVACLFLSMIKGFNPINAELNPICHLLALLGAHHILHVSGIRVKGQPGF